jgi:hypothetical protein
VELVGTSGCFTGFSVGGVIRRQPARSGHWAGMNDYPKAVRVAERALRDNGRHEVLQHYGINTARPHERCTRDDHNVRRAVSSKICSWLSALFVGSILSGCNPYHDGMFSTNFDARHEAFVQELNASVGRPFNDECRSEQGACPPTPLPSGLVRYTAANYRIYIGCTVWHDVDPETNLVVSVGLSGDKRACSKRGF